MDKQKQIEEMAKDICGYCLKIIEEKECPRTENQHCFNARLEEATYAYKLGYRKIPENAVVLTMEEYERLGLVEETVQEYKTINGQPVLVKERKEVKKIPTDIAEFIRKETAEKYHDMVNEAIVNMEWAREDTHIKLVTQEACLRANNEICKEFTEGK